jgi:hypothetical protein
MHGYKMIMGYELWITEDKGNITIKNCVYKHILDFEQNGITVGVLILQECVLLCLKLPFIVEKLIKFSTPVSFLMESGPN